MEDGNFSNGKEDKVGSTSLDKLYCEQPGKYTTNGHELTTESSSPSRETLHVSQDFLADDKCKKRVNPLKIHLGKRPFVDNSLQHYSSSKKKATLANRQCEPTTVSHNTLPRVPKLIPKKKVNRSASLFHNVTSQSYLPQDEQDKPVPRLVPKSQLLQYKKSAAEKAAQANEYQQNTSLQPMVKFKCRKCCSMSFKTLAMLKEHQQVCRAQAKEPALNSEAPASIETSSGGPSRVTKKVYLCSACGTYYENWNLFLHMREVHNRHICLFCLGMFSKAEKLSAHLTNKHNVQEYCFDTKEDFFNLYNGTLYLMCCECDEICCEQDDFFNHDCNNIKPKPVPVLVSKNASKINSIKQSKNKSETMGNGPPSIGKDMKSMYDTMKLDKRHLVETKPVTQIMDREPVNYDTSISPDSATDSRRELLNTTVDNRLQDDCKTVSNQNQVSAANLHENQELLTNGDDNTQNSDRSESPEHMDTDPSPIRPPIKADEHYPPVEKENCGIKLKLSLNKANSPVIINSTVDPTVGLQNPHKPPTRTRRPPKRYEKDGTLDTSLPRTPSIKMTICDKADSPFVKTTIYENNQETTLLNNNLETTPKSHKTENTVFSTIYDNKLENLNTLNRVPKLTVRVPKELLDKDSSSDYSSDSDVSEKLTVDESLPVPQYQLEDKQEQPFVERPQVEPVVEETKEAIEITKDESIVEDTKLVPDTLPDTTESQTIDVEKVTEEPPIEEIPIIELKLDRPLDKYPLKELLKLFLSLTTYNCIYCNHARKIAVNCEQLSLHMAAQHRFSATVDSITAEELMPETITSKIKTDAVELCSVYINLDTYDTEEKCEEVKYDHLFECFQCYFKTPVHKDLCLHFRKMHQKTILLCVMCKTNFYSYSELLCHLCPGTYDSEYEIRFRCCLCNVDSIPSSFRLMVHLRKIHNACDVCLEFCHSQAKLSNHVWKHKLHHLCYRCGIAYRNKPDITKHLFWKHGTESVLCKKCLQKKWPHIYHFCTPPAVFVCDECSLQFTKAVYLKVHKRFHSEEYPHPCIEEGCTEKFVAKKLLMKHLEEHQRKLATVNLEEKMEQGVATSEVAKDASKEPIPIIDLEDEKPVENTTIPAVEAKPEGEPEQLSKKAKKKKLKDKDALLLDVNLPELNLSESDSSDESDSGVSQSVKEEKVDGAPKTEEEPYVKDPIKAEGSVKEEIKPEEKSETIEDEKPDEKQVLEIWDNFKKYQAKTEFKKEKTPPLVPIKKHVCESDHDYCLIPTDLNGDEEPFGSKKKKKKDKKRGEFSSSSSSSSSDSDSSCSCGSKCSCSSSSGSSSSSSSDSDSSDEPNHIKKVGKKKQRVKTLPNRRLSTGSNVDVMGMSETPILIPEKTEPPIAETDLETDESDTDEEFYDEHPQKLANKLYAEKRNQLMLLASVAPSDGGSMSGEASRPITPIKEEQLETEKKIPEKKEIKSSSSKKKSKKKKKSKSKKHESIKINIPKDVVPKPEQVRPSPIIHNKITISLQSNTVQIPETPAHVPANIGAMLAPPADNKRASKRRRVPNKFYGYSSDDDSVQTPQQLALKPQQPPKLEWRKEDLPSPVSHRAKKEVPTSTVAPKMYSYTEPIRLTAPIPDPEPPRILMNTESLESSDSDSSEEGVLEIYERGSGRNAIPVPPPTYLNSGTSSLPYPFQRPAGRQAREGESVYCYCRCPYDEVSEMIACDAEGCTIEWFHFECVGIMVPPKGKWYCPECRKKQTYSGYR